MDEINKVTFRGSVAEVRWAYHKAADLSTWEVQGDSLTATVVSHDAFKVSQRPLTFVVPRPTGQPWVWPIQSLQVAGGTVRAVLGSPE